MASTGPIGPASRSPKSDTLAPPVSGARDGGGAAACWAAACTAFGTENVTVSFGRAATVPASLDPNVIPLLPPSSGRITHPQFSAPAAQARTLAVTSTV